MAAELQGWYSVGYVHTERDAKGSLIHRVIHAAWWTGEPTAKPWRTPDSYGTWLHSDGLKIYNGGDRWAEEMGDRSIRDALSGVHLFDCGPDSWTRWKTPIATHKIDPAWARAAYREKAGKAPNYRKPKGKTTFYGGSEWAKRPPTRPVRELFAELDEKYRAWEDKYRDLLNGVYRSDSDASKLGLAHSYTEADVNRAFRKVVAERRLHPDQGGDGVEFRSMSDARDAALKGATT